jgi:hypothetical protein
MAFTNNPTQSTYKAIPIEFDGATFFRSGNITVQRDCQIVNMYYDRVSQMDDKQKMSAVKKRPGLSTSIYNLTKVSPSDVIRGSFYDVDQNAFYWVIGNKLYNCKPDVASTTNLIQTINTSTGYVGFCSYLKSDNTRYVCISDGTDLWIHNYVAGTCLEVTDGDLPSPHQPYPVYLDGYLFLIKTNTGDIYNSDLDDVFSWTPGDFITAEISSDYAIRMVKAKNYLCVFGYNSVEYFYDGANVSGSPLSRNDSPFRGIGLVTGLSTIGDTTYFVGQDSQQNLGVYSLNSFKIERISNEIVDRTLQTIAGTNNEKSQVPLNTDGVSISVDGHNFYVLVTTQTTWVYDIDEKFWYEWKNSAGAGLKVEACWQMNNGNAYVGITGQSYISILSPATYQDFGANFTTRYTTPNENAGTFHWKNCHRVMLYADQHLATGTSNATVSWSDDDWATTASTRNINVLSENSYFKNAGRFRTRSFRVEYSDNYPLRMTALEIDLNVGSH